MSAHAPLYRTISRCRICGNPELVKILDLGTQALTGVFPRDRTQPVGAGPLELVKCMGPQSCGLVQLHHSYTLGELYGEHYGYRSGLNASMVAHLQSKVRRILELVRLGPESLVIDIGSNDSTTLQAYPRSTQLIGVDPTGTKFREFYPPHIRLIPEFFSAQAVRAVTGERRADVITSFSMFYDLEDPLGFMREVRELLAPEGVWVFEQSYLPTMLERNSYDTVCHEHLEYYALKQVAWMTERVDLEIIDVEFNDVNGGSFSVTAAHRGARSPSAAVQRALAQEQRLALDELRPYVEFASRVEANRQQLQAFLRKARHAGQRVCALGASTKGNVLLQYCAITPQDVALVGEVNTDKFGSFTPGTLLPIVPQAQVLATRPDFLLILPWHFRRFFEQSPALAGRTLLFPLPNLETVGIPGG
jgi:NDP-4-keto-2,6-dideoxyhexose 3-C-methyltransferase